MRIWARIIRDGIQNTYDANNHKNGSLLFVVWLSAEIRHEMRNQIAGSAKMNMFLFWILCQYKDRVVVVPHIGLY